MTRGNSRRISSVLLTVRTGTPSLSTEKFVMASCPPYRGTDTVSPRPRFCSGEIVDDTLCPTNLTESQCLHVYPLRVNSGKRSLWRDSGVDSSWPRLNVLLKTQVTVLVIPTSLFGQTTPWSHGLRTTWGTVYQNHHASFELPGHRFGKPLVFVKI